MKKLIGKTAIITGATSGIGLATAKLFLQEGAKVVLTGRTQAKLDAIIPQLQGEYLLVPAEASSRADSKALIEKTVTHFGKIDILFLNAGIFRLETIGQLSESIYDEVFNVHVRGPLFTIQEADPHFNEGASIILNSSIINIKGIPPLAAVASSKAALRSLTRCLAASYGPRGIRVNTVSPGPIETPIYQKHNVWQQQVDEMKAAVKTMVPLGRFGTPEEVAPTALFLACADSSFITGAEIPVDGGFAQI